MKFKVLKEGDVPLSKTVRIMKMIFFLMIAACLQVSAKSYSQKITISEKNVSIERVFKEIEKQSGYVFWYESDLLNPDLKISISVENVGIDQVLNVCLKGQPLTYTILGKTIVLKSKPDVLVPLIETIVEMPPPITVKGKVTDDNGNAVSGVSVLIKGNTNGTQTDANGNYSISDVPDNAILVFTSVGHYTKEIPVGNIRIINITLTIKVEGLEETVVVAYGKSKVRDVTGSISHLGTQEIKNAPMGSTISSMLQGKAAGVNVVIQSASPTSPISVIIRGASSLTGDNQPLWVIDGVPDYAVSTTQVLNSTNSIHGNDQSATTTGSIYNTLYNLNLSDVESIDILKDASATALYGSRAANGVVIVTTKKGRAGMAPIMEFSAKFGYLKQDFNGFDLMNTSEYMNAADKGAREEAFTRGAFDFNTRHYLDEAAFMNLNTSEFNRSTFKTLDTAYGTGNTNYLKDMTQNPINQQYNLSIRGGTNNISYYVSLFNNNVQGIIKTGNSNTNGGRINLEAKVSKNIKFGLNLTGSFRETNDKDYMLTILEDIRPDIPPFNADGSLYTKDTYTENPYTTLKNTFQGKGQSFSGSSYLEFTLAKGLLLKSTYSISAQNNDYTTFYRTGSAYYTVNTKTFDNDKYATNIWENTLTYAKNVGRHDFLGLVGFSTEKNSQLHYGMNGSNFPDDNVLNDFGSAAIIGALEESYTASTLVSSFARGTYKYNNRYILSGTIRRDGSSRFGPDKRWGIFPSVAAAWLISEEKFMKTGKLSKIFSYLKLRASGGRTGSQNLGNYDWRTGVSGTTFNELPANAPSSIGNPNLQWEQTLMYDLGLDFGLFNDRISGSFGVYQKNTSDLIYSNPLPPSSSVSSISSNVASLSNKGLEIAIKGEVIKKRDLTVTLDFNTSQNINRLIEFNSQLKVLNPSYMQIEEGGRTGQWYGYKQANRLFVTQEEIIAMQSLTATGAKQFYRTSTEAPGDLIFMDLNGDGKITTADKTYLGSSEPKFYGGFGGTVIYKNFFFNATFTYSYGNKRYWALPSNFFASSNFNQINLITDKSATLLSPYEATYPRVTPYGDGANGGGNTNFSDFSLYDASYIKLSALNITYRIPQKIFKTNVLQGVEISFQASNLFTITKYPGFDPQANWTSSRINSYGSGIDNSTYPNAKNFNLGFKFNFK